MKKVHVKIPATSANLGPGFDVLGVALPIFNEVSMEAEDGFWVSAGESPALSLTVEGEGFDLLPRDESNLVFRAAMRAFDAAKRWPRALRVRCLNHIPLLRGLGSSAAATLGGVYAANQICGKPLSGQEVLDLAVAIEGHPDNVVPALIGGFCISGFLGQSTCYLKFPAPADLRAVICIPQKPLSTSEARRVLPSRVPLKAATFTSSHVAFLLGALWQKKYEWLSFAMEDVLHQPARTQLIPGLKEVLQVAKKAGAWGAALSGAGSSVIAFSRKSVARRVGEAMQKRFAARGMPSHWLDLSLENRGIQIL